MARSESMSKQEFYDISTQFRTEWGKTRDLLNELLKSPVIAFSLLVDHSAHGIHCPKADAVYKLAQLDDMKFKSELALLCKLQGQILDLEDNLR